MARVLSIGSWYYQPDNITTYLDLNITESVEGGRHKLVYSVTCRQTPTGSGYNRTLNSGYITIDGVRINMTTGSIHNGSTPIKEATLYTDKDSISVFMQASVGGTSKSNSTTLNFTPISSPVYVKEGNYAEYVPFNKDTNYSEVTFMVKENGSWGEY